MSFARQVPTLKPDQGVGTCHLAEDPNELIAIPSDSGPDVPCTQPHQTETMWVTTLTGSVADSPTRPNGELLNTTFGGQCYDYSRERSYLGAGPNDVTWGVLSWGRYPTAAAWARGDRTLVCQGSAAIDTPKGPTIDFPMAGVMPTIHSARFRLCRSATGMVTCDRPHLMEDTSPDVTLQGSWPGEAAVATMAVGACVPIVEDYMGQPVSARPDLVVHPDVPTVQQWAAGNRSVNCWIATKSGQLVTGTVRGGLR